MNAQKLTLRLDKRMIEQLIRRYVDEFDPLFEVMAIHFITDGRTDPEAEADLRGAVADLRRKQS